MTIDKPFKSIDEQVQILKTRNLIFNNLHSAKEKLTRYGYYEIINGYKQSFLMDKSDDTKGYIKGTTFEHIFDLYELDKNIRSTIKRSTEEFELYFKQTLAYVISEEYTESDNIYALPDNYNSGRSHYSKTTSKSSRDKLISKLNFIIKDNTHEPFNHYREVHNNVPPWITIKGLTFGETIFWYRLSKERIRNKIIMKIFGINSINNDIKQAFGDMISLVLKYRNVAAHGGRIFNYRSKKYSLRYSDFFYNTHIVVSKNQFEKGIGRSSTGVLIEILSTINNPDPYISLVSWIEKYLTAYISKYPQDKLLITNHMELQFINTQLDL